MGAKNDYFVIATVEISMERKTKNQVDTLLKRVSKDIETIDKIERYLTKVLPVDCVAENFRIDLKTLTNESE